MKTNNIRDKIINTFFNQGRNIKSSVNNAKINDWNTDSAESNLSPQLSNKKNPKMIINITIVLITFFMF